MLSGGGSDSEALADDVASSSDDSAADTTGTQDAPEATEPENDTTTDSPAADEAGDSASAAPEADASEAEQSDDQPADGETADEPSNDALAATDEASDDQPADKAKDEEAEDEVVYPAQKFNGNANGVSVNVDAPKGAFPEGTKMSVKAVNRTQVIDAVEDAIGQEAESVAAVDITFTWKNKDGKTTEIEPKKAIKVVLKSDIIKQADEASVVHISDNGDANVVTSTTADTNQMSFKSCDFSIYVIAGTDVNPIYTVTFEVNDTVIDTQKVKSGEIVHVPDDPKAPKGSVFAGWFDGDAQISEDAAFNGNADVTYKAKFSEYCYVTFYADESEGERMVLRTDKVVKGTVYNVPSNIVAEALSGTKKFQGWKLSASGEELVTKIESVDEDVNLYPEFAEAFRVTFNENDGVEIGGASYTASRLVNQGETVEQPSEPSFTGHDFMGWYTDEACTTAFDFETPITANITLYAGWEASVTTFNIIVWKQKISDEVELNIEGRDDEKKYDYAESLQVSAQAGSLVENIPASVSGKSYTGFTYNKAKTEGELTQGIEVKADGTTTVNVYFDRNVMTIIFKGVGDFVDVYSPTTDKTGVRYAFVDGVYKELKQEGVTVTTAKWTYGSNHEYKGTRYLRTRTKPTPGTYSSSWEWGTTYYYVPTELEDGTQYGLVDSYWEELTKKTTSTTMYTYYLDGKEFTGQLFSKSKAQEKRIVYTGLYGQDLPDWPNPGNNKQWDQLLYLASFEGTLFDANNTLEKEAVDIKTSKTVIFYLENADGTYTAKPAAVYSYSQNSKFNVTDRFNGYHFKDYQYTNSLDYPTSTSWKNSVDNSDEKNVYTSEKWENNTYIHVRYDRVDSTIEFKNGNETIKTATEKFDTSLKGYETPIGFSRGGSDASEYTFAGWFVDPELTTMAVFEDMDEAAIATKVAELQDSYSNKIVSVVPYTEVPKTNLVFYAGWFESWYGVNLDFNGGEPASASQKNTFWLKYKDKVDQSLKSAKKDGYTLIGWYDESDKEWDFGEGVSAANTVKNSEGSSPAGYLNLKARWASSSPITVEYEGEGIEGISDSKLYVDGASARAAAAPVLGGKKFVGWGYGESSVVKAGELFTVSSEDAKNSVVTLTARYEGVSKANKVSLSYVANIPDGGSATAPAAIEKQDNNYVIESLPSMADANEHYTFLGWSQDVLAEAATYEASDKLGLDELEDSDAVKGDGLVSHTLYGVWEPVQYTVTFVDDDGTEISSVKYAYGTKAADIVEPDTPTKAATAEYTYAFAGWEPAIANVTDDAMYRAKYTATKNKYTVTFVDEDGTVLQSSALEYGATPSYSGEIPAKEPTDEFTYLFAGWDKVIAAVTGDVTYTATFDSTINKYTVTFDSNGGTNVAAQTVEYGSKATKPTAPTKDGYTFHGWYSDEGLTKAYNFDTEVKGNIPLYAKWATNVEVTISGNTQTVPYTGDKQLYNYDSEGAYVITYKVAGANGAALPDDITQKILKPDVGGTEIDNYQGNITVELAVSESAGINYKLVNGGKAQDTVTLVIKKADFGEQLDGESRFAVGDLHDVVYNGRKQELEPKVTDTKTNKVLEKGKDYTVAYVEDTTNVGQVAVTITGAGNYTGEVTHTYQITPATIKLEGESVNLTYGESIPSELEKLVTAPKLLNNADSLSYTATVQNANQETVTGVQPVGEYTIVPAITGGEEVTIEDKPYIAIGNYYVNVANGLLAIAKKSFDDENADIKVGSVADVTYNGSPQTPAVTVKDGDKTLNLDEDYTVEYDANNNVHVTDASTITIKGIGNYSGELTRTFKILPRTVTITGADLGTKTYGYSAEGVDLIKSITGLIENSEAGAKPDGFEPAYTVKVVDVEGAEAATVPAAGSYTVKVEASTPQGVEGYTSDYVIKTVDGSLTIVKKAISEDAGFTVSDPSDVTYDGTEQKLEPTVKDGSTALVKDVDYDLSYSDDCKNAGTVTVTVTGKGNYSGSVEKTYKINPIEIKVNPLINGKNTNYESAYTGSPVSFTTDFTDDKLVVADRGNVIVSVSVTATKGGSKVDEIRDQGVYEVVATGDITSPNYTLKFGDLLTATITAKTIIDNESAFAVTGPADVTYNGAAQKPAVTVVDKAAGATLTESVDYRLIYSDNLNVARDADGEATAAAKVTIEGLGNYAGSIEKSFTVKPATVTVTAESKEQVYGETAVALTAQVGSEKNVVVNNATGEGIITLSTGAEDVIAFSLELAATASSGAKYPNVGQYPITVTANQAQGNYDVTVVPSTYTVTTSEAVDNIDLTVNDLTETYNGYSQTIAPATASDASGSIFKIEYSRDGETWTTDVTKVGQINATVDSNGNVVPVKVQVRASSDNYKTASGEIAYKTGEAAIAVRQKEITLTPSVAENTKIYDGESVDFGIASFTDQLVEPDQAKAGELITAYAVAKKGDETVGEIIEVGEYTVSVEAEQSQGNYKVTAGTPANVSITAKSIEDPEDQGKLANGFTVADVADVTYKGSAYTPEPAVTDDETGKPVNVSYAYEDNVNAGTATVTITATGNYSGTVTKTFTIEPAEITLTPTVDTNQKVYDGKVIAFDIKDFTDQMKGGDSPGLIKYELVASKGETAVNEIVEVGEYSARVVANEQQGNYLVKVTDPVTAVITAKGIGEIDDPVLSFGVESLNDVVYNGQSWEPVVTVKDGATELTTADYEATYANNVNAGTATVTVTGKGNYEGSKTVEFTINKRSVTLKSADRNASYGKTLEAGGEVNVEAGSLVEGEEPTYTFTGSRTLVGGTDKQENKFSVSDNGAFKTANYNAFKVYGDLVVTDTGLNPDDLVTKSHAAGQFKLGDTVTFNITATNIYDEEKTITLTEKEGVTLGQSTFAGVQPGEQVKTTATYVIAEADVIAGSFTNNVGVSYNGAEPIVTNNDEVTKDEIADPAGHVTIAKEITSQPASEGGYALGETIAYKVTVTNDGNITLGNVKANDPLTNDEWTIESLAPGASQEFTPSHVVSEPDIVAGKGKLTNEAKFQSAELPEGVDGDTPIESTNGSVDAVLQVAEPSLALTKKADTEGPVNVGDTVTYTIEVANNGNVSVDGIQVEDALTNETWTVESLAPSASESFETTYTVTEADVLAGSVVNTATVKGADPDGKQVEDADGATIDTVPADRTLAVSKSIVAPKSGYEVGDAIGYQIEVTNKGNVAVNDVTVTDQMSDAAGAVEFTDAAGGVVNGSQVVFDSIAAGETKTIAAAYTIDRADAGKRISNSAIVSTPETPGSEPTDEVTTDPVEDEYTLTINYVYAEGGTAAESFTGSYLAGEEYDVASPAVEGYTPNYGRMAGNMPAQNVTVQVVYTANASEEVVPTPAPSPTPTPTPTDDDDDESSVPADDASTTTPANDGATTMLTATITPAPTTDNGNQNADDANTGATAATAPAAAAAAPAAVAAPAPAPAAAPVAAPAAADNAAQAPAAAPTGTVTIDDDGNPLVESIDDDANALASGESGAAGSWSIFDVLATLLATVLSAVMLFLAFGRNRKGDGDEPTIYKRRRALRVASLAPAIAAIAALVLTQDFSQPMALFDQWSVLFGILAVANVVLAVASRKRESGDSQGGGAQPSRPAHATA